MTSPLVWRIKITGLVQGVGFRPFVWRLASEMGFRGHVRNSPAGVEIVLAATTADRDVFLERLNAEAPPLARIDQIIVSQCVEPVGDAFDILESSGGAVATGIVPDAAICPDCRREIRDPADRRYRYPFANCTHCGPRLSIVESIPYDRATTTMRRFPLCPACRAEYLNPADRRFHAVPIACATCGPQIWLEDQTGQELAVGDEALARTVGLLRDGGIVAIKGIGGFHLACRAGDEIAVATLRQRKMRDAKPFALMAGDLSAILAHCRVSDREAELLVSAAAPIVLLGRNENRELATGVAPGQSRLGFMLPYTPLHTLLFDALGDDVLVMTSANASGEPQVFNNEEARAKLAAIADATLFHDREIANRVDDSVCRVDEPATSVIRLARGYAPASLPMPVGFADAPPLLAMGGDLKNAFAFAGRGQVTVTQHIGDLDEASTLAELESTIGLYRSMFELKPRLVAVDLHPAYRSAAAGRRLAESLGATVVEIQHHHAHMAACLADNGVAANGGQSLGIILDGLGWGSDGTIWGGEFLVGDYTSVERVAWFQPVHLSGGDAASREPWRNARAHLLAAYGKDGIAAALRGTAAANCFAGKSIGVIDRMIENGVNAPLSSSAGRFFDAVAAVLGLCADRQTYEGQAAMELEALAEDEFSDETAWPVSVEVGAGAIDWRPFWSAILTDIRADVGTARISARFHHSLIAAVALTARRIAASLGIRRIALSGGVFQNRLLLEGVHRHLTRNGFEVLCHRRTPTNDGGIAFGQAAIAAALGENAPNR